MKAEQTPLVLKVRRVVRQHKEINVEMLLSRHWNRVDYRILKGGLRSLQNDHPNRWRDPEMLGSLLKRIRSRSAQAEGLRS